MSIDAAPRTAARRRKARWVTVGLIAVVAVGAAAGLMLMLRPKASPTAGLSTDKATRTSLVVAVSGDGEARPLQTFDVYPEVSGTVDSVFVELGDTVAKGDKLFSIDSADLDGQMLQAKAALRQSQGSVSGARSQLEQARLQKTKAERSLDKLRSAPATRTSETDKAMASTELKAAKAAVTSANAALTAASAGVANTQHTYDRAADRADHTVVFAPADGVVTALSVAEGSSVSTGGGASISGTAAGAAAGAGASAPVVISDTADLKVRVAVNEVDMPRLAVSQAATVAFDAVTGLVLTGEVSWIAPTGVSTQGVVTYDVDIELAEQDPRLRPDMTASADIITQRKDDVLVVSNAAVKVDGSQKYVDVLTEGGRTTRANITVGATTDTTTEIVSGLEEGATVVIGAVAEEPQGGMRFAPPGMGGNR